jgi:uncharacterized membrane protein YccC
MTKQDKFIAYFLIFQAISGAAMFGWEAYQTPPSIGVWVVYSILIAAAMVSGIGSLLRKHWAALLGIAVFAAQTPIILTQSFTWYVPLGTHLDFSAAWIGEATIGANVVGLAMFLWANVRDAAANNSARRQ